MKIFLIIIILISINEFSFQFIDNPIIYSDIYDPSLKSLPQNLIDSFMSDHYASNIFLTRKHPCKDPNETKLMSQLTQFYLENIQLFYVSLSDSFNNSSSSSSSNNIIQKNDEDIKRDCAEQKTVNISPVCPWHQVVSERIDKYPFKRMNAACNCKSKCLIDGKDKSKNYKCMPIQMPMPMLARGRCHINGLYEWRNEIENVDVFCACIKY